MYTYKKAATGGSRTGNYTEMSDKCNGAIALAISMNFSQVRFMVAGPHSAPKRRGTSCLRTRNATHQGVAPGIAPTPQCPVAAVLPKRATPENDVRDQ